MPNIVIDYGISLSNIELWVSQRFRVDGNIFENAPRVDANLFENGYKKMRFQKYPDTCGRGLSIFVQSYTFIDTIDVQHTQQLCFLFTFIIGDPKMKSKWMKHVQWNE